MMTAQILQKLAILGIAVIAIAMASKVEAQPIYDVCMHKEGGNFNSGSEVEMQFEFESKRGKSYIYEFYGPQRVWLSTGDYRISSESRKQKGDDGLISQTFFWDSSASPQSWRFSCSIYEQNSRGEKGDWLDPWTCTAIKMRRWSMPIQRKSALFSINTTARLTGIPASTSLWTAIIRDAGTRCLDGCQAVGSINATSARLATITARLLTVGFITLGLARRWVRLRRE